MNPLGHTDSLKLIPSPPSSRIPPDGNVVMDTCTRIGSPRYSAFLATLRRTDDFVSMRSRAMQCEISRQFLALGPQLYCKGDETHPKKLFSARGMRYANGASHISYCNTSCTSAVTHRLISYKVIVVASACAIRFSFNFAVIVVNRIGNESHIAAED